MPTGGPMRSWARSSAIEPSPRLRELERAILRHDPSLGARAIGAARCRRCRGPPRLSWVAGPRSPRSPRLFESGARLVTLVGPGGVGKTRLGIATAQELGERERRRCRFVDLASLADATLVPSALASTLGVADEGDTVRGAIATRLAGSDLFLVLDNFEHVQDAARPLPSCLPAQPGSASS